jgi:hypothetical protein
MSRHQCIPFTITSYLSKRRIVKSCCTVKSSACLEFECLILRVIEPMREARFDTPLLQCSLGMPWSIKHIVAQLVLSILQPDNFCFIALPTKSIDALEGFLSFSDEVEDSPLARLPTAVPPRLSSSGL